MIPTLRNIRGMGAVDVKLKGRTIVLEVALPRHRELSVVIAPKGDTLLFEIWGRFKGERLWHAWPSPHLADDFLERMESAIVLGGLDELAEACLGMESDADLMERSTSAVEAILEAASAAPPAPPAN